MPLFYTWQIWTLSPHILSHITETCLELVFIFAPASAHLPSATYAYLHTLDHVAHLHKCFFTAFLMLGSEKLTNQFVIFFKSLLEACPDGPGLVDLAEFLSLVYMDFTDLLEATRTSRTSLTFLNSRTSWSLRRFLSQFFLQFLW